MTTSSRAIRLDGLLSDYSAKFLLDDFLSEKKPRAFKFRIVKAGALPASFQIDNVNDKPVDPIQLKLGDSSIDGDATTTMGEVEVKTLAKHFQKRINRIQVAYDETGQRVGTEVLIEIQM